MPLRSPCCQGRKRCGHCREPLLTEELQITRFMTEPLQAQEPLSSWGQPCQSPRASELSPWSWRELISRPRGNTG